MSFASHLIWANAWQPRSHVVPHQARAVEELWEIIKTVKPKRVLDAGSGEPPSVLKTMLEENSIQVATLDNLSRGDVEGDLHSLPFQADSFDLVVARHSLEHCICPIVVLREFRRVAPNVLVVVPEYKQQWRYWSGHFSIFPRGVWEHMFRLAGFDVVLFSLGDFSFTKGLWVDVEWRYLLKRSNMSFGPYGSDGHYVGEYHPLASAGEP